MRELFLFAQIHVKTVLTLGTFKEYQGAASEEDGMGQPDKSQESMTENRKWFSTPLLGGYQHHS